MGKILKTNLSRRTMASGMSLRRNSITPYIIQELLVSPGWTREEIITPFRSFISSGLSRDVIVIYSHLFPAIVLQRVDLVKILVYFGDCS